jgi:2-oxoglutarate dehydrogenase E1 component
MHEGVMKAWLESSHFNGGNVAYIEELYEAYLDDASSVSIEWREVFDALPKVEGVGVDVKHSEIKAQFAELAKKQA